MKKDVWAARSAFLEAIMTGTEYLDECDVVVPVSRVAEFLTYVKQVEKETGVEVKSFGHAGDGNVHIYCCGSHMERKEFLTSCGIFMQAVYRKAAELGGQVSGEHGIGHGKLSYLEDAVGETGMRLMEGIKRVFDPHMILNPGKVCYRL